MFNFAHFLLIPNIILGFAGAESCGTLSLRESALDSSALLKSKLKSAAGTMLALI
jgi:hypothetical protein